MSIFPKELTHDFRQKFESSSESQFLGKDLYMMFNYILNDNKGFLDYKKAPEKSQSNIV